jgi:para-aminobenzoate synthetase component I
MHCISTGVRSWRCLPLNERTGSEIFDILFRQSGGIATLLESPHATPVPPQWPELSSAFPGSKISTQLARYSICAGAPKTVNGKLQMWTPAIGQILPFLKQLLSSATSSSISDSPPVPFTGGWLGWLGYDLAWEIERLPMLKSDTLPFPTAFWYEPENFAVLDRQTQQLWLAASDSSQLDELEERLERSTPRLTESVDIQLKSTRLEPDFCTSQTEYEAAVRQAKKYIQAGDIFQTNLSLRFSAPTFADSWSIYRALQQINPSPMSSYWQTPWGDVISCSPERLVQLEGNCAQTRPIAGTRSRGTTDLEDKELALELLGNAKEGAEHIMLVDLERNDLGKVCDFGSVTVDELLAIELYSHVMHLVSNVRGTISSDRDSIDLIKAVFPGGTITGCPKVRCMQIIEELEPLRRNLFYGSCGYLDYRGNLDLNILIRTLLYTNPPRSKSELNLVWGQVGAGIVADSQPEKEWYESLSKAKAQLKAIEIAN